MKKNNHSTEIILEVEVDKYSTLEERYDKMFNDYIDTLHRCDKIENVNVKLSNENDWYKNLLSNHYVLLESMDLNYIENYIRKKKLKNLNT